MKRFLLSVSIALFFAISSFATTVERLSLDAMVNKARSIVHGKVRSSRVHWSANRKLILTTYTIDVEETIKGPAAKSVDVTMIGGKIGDLTVYAAGMPSFEQGEDAVVFLENAGDSSSVVGLSQGKFSVRNGEVSNAVSNLSFPDGRSGVPLKMRLEDFKRQIQNRLR